MNARHENHTTWQHDHTFGQDRRKPGELRTFVVVLLTAATMVLEIAAGMARTFYTRPTIVDYLGILDSGMIFSLHALLLCHDLAGMLLRLWNGVTVDEEHLALELTRSVGPKGNYLWERHTRDHCREHHWGSRYFGVNFPRSSSPDIPDRELIERIDKDLREILATHRDGRLAAVVAWYF